MYSLSKLKDLKRVRVKRIFTGKYTKENLDQYKKDIIEALKEQLGDSYNEENFGESPMSFTYQNRTWMKPGHYKEMIGDIVFRSKDYYFEYTDKVTGELKKSYGEIEKDCLRDFGFEIECMGGTLQYHILD